MSLLLFFVLRINRFLNCLREALNSSNDIEEIKSRGQPHFACCYREATNSTSQIAVFRSRDQCWCSFSLLQLSVIRLAVNSSNQVAERRSRELNVLNLFTFLCYFVVYP